MSYSFAPDCFDCKWRMCLHGLHACQAFMKGIPDEIFWEGVKHDRKIFDQKNDIVFEKGEPELYDKEN